LQVLEHKSGERKIQQAVAHILETVVTVAGGGRGGTMRCLPRRAQPGLLVQPCRMVSIVSTWIGPC
jgi:hypothetical protein